MEDGERVTRGEDEDPNNEDHLTIRQLRERLERDRRVERELMQGLERSRARDAELAEDRANLARQNTLLMEENHRLNENIQTRTHTGETETQTSRSSPRRRRRHRSEERKAHNDRVEYEREVREREREIENVRDLEMRSQERRARRINQESRENLKHGIQIYNGERGSILERETQRYRRETSLERETRIAIERSATEQRALETAARREREHVNANQAILQQLKELKAAMKNNSRRGGRTIPFFA
ncbi:arginine and glutamate-rich protein 1-like [Papaver somniferum]|uniref:arginine and glutamate-rich protein 1-like n=1 Tax=Papaver somniferum TaxID=3469 RepID=UPI000E6FBB78|nr:arginine and glutamate-rich protein 1-like [Papaver somniferum]